MYEVSIDVKATAIEPNKPIVMEWPGYSGHTTVKWTFREGTFVDVEETGWTGTGDEFLKYVCESTGGFTWTLAERKAFLEHGASEDRGIIRWNLRWGENKTDRVRGVNIMRVRGGKIVEGLGYVKG